MIWVKGVASAVGACGMWKDDEDGVGCELPDQGWISSIDLRVQLTANRLVENKLVFKMTSEPEG